MYQVFRSQKLGTKYSNIKNLIPTLQVSKVSTKFSNLKNLVPNFQISKIWYQKLKKLIISSQCFLVPSRYQKNWKKLLVPNLVPYGTKNKLWLEEFSRTVEISLGQNNFLSWKYTHQAFKRHIWCIFIMSWKKRPTNDWA